METAANSIMLSNSDAIALWQNSGDVLDLTNDNDIIASLFGSCAQLLKFLLSRARANQPAASHRQSLEDSMATMFFWGEEFGVAHGQLDKILLRSEETRDLTLSVLISLADFLSDDLLSASISSSSERENLLQQCNIHPHIDKARGIIGEWEGPNREKSSDMEELYNTFEAKVARLSVLGPILEDMVPDCFEFEEARTLTQLQDRPAHQYYADLVGAKFPAAQNSLVERLGKCNWERYNRIQKQRTANSQKELHNIGDGDGKSKFHDSGLGTSNPAQSVFYGEIGSPTRALSEYAETIYSRRAELSHKYLPPFPEEGKKGKPFLCSVCHANVKIQRRQAWKKHVFQDILAYVCVFDDCPVDRGFFQDREAMTIHLGAHHLLAPEWNSHECPLCLERTGDGRITISLHYARHMEEIALGALPRSAESDGGSQSSSSDEEIALPDTDSQRPEVVPLANSRILGEADKTSSSLGEYACKQINELIIKPMIGEKPLAPFHPLINEVPLRIGRKDIRNLRDLEKTLIFLAPEFAATPEEYLQFTEKTIKCIHRCVETLSEMDQRTPNDRPYTNNYFLELIEQVRGYAAIMAETRKEERLDTERASSEAMNGIQEILSQNTKHPNWQKEIDALREKAKDKDALIAKLRSQLKSDPSLTSSSLAEALTLESSNPLSTLDTSDAEEDQPSEKTALRGNHPENGQTVELVHGKKEDGSSASIMLSGKNEHIPTYEEGKLGRRIARKRKSDKPGDVMHVCKDCKKEFKRPCDLTKHEKTHSRPWKCTMENCKYYELGWPTEKERDRHVTDKHSNPLPQFKCLYPPCTYTSKRESNCKQHMEKAHGWEYVRSKRGKASESLTPLASPVASPFLHEEDGDIGVENGDYFEVDFDIFANLNSGRVVENNNAPAIPHTTRSSSPLSRFGSPTGSVPSIDNTTSGFVDDGFSEPDSIENDFNLAITHDQSNAFEVPDSSKCAPPQQHPTSSALPSLSSEQDSRYLKFFNCKEKGCIDLRFSSVEQLLRHENEAHRMRGNASPRMFECTYEGCGKSFSRAEHMLRHQSNHNPKQIYHCDFPECRRSFIRKDLYLRHKDRHTAQEKLS